MSIPRGVDLLDYLNKFAGENGVETAIVMAIGSLYDVEIGYYDTGEDRYVVNKLNGFYELLSGLGNISLREGKPFTHIHVVLGDRMGRTYGGHLVSGKVFVVEAKIMVLKGEPARRSRITNTLWLWG